MQIDARRHATTLARGANDSFAFSMAEGFQALTKPTTPIHARHATGSC